MEIVDKSESHDESYREGELSLWEDESTKFYDQGAKSMLGSHQKSWGKWLKRKGRQRGSRIEGRSKKRKKEKIYINI